MSYIYNILLEVCVRYMKWKIIEFLNIQLLGFAYNMTIIWWNLHTRESFVFYAQLHEVVILNTPETKKLSVFDCPGIKTDETASGVLEEDLEKVINGNVIKNYKFSSEHVIQNDNESYRGLPTISDTMHCVLFVIDAKSLDEEKDYPVLRRVQDYLASKNIPLRLILTKVDQLDLCIPGDLSGIFKSKQMADKVRLAKEKFGLQESQILPIASYVQETRQNITKDVLALQAVENILSEALEYVKNQVPG